MCLFYFLAENDYKGREFFRIDQKEIRKFYKKNKSFPKQKVMSLSGRLLGVRRQTKSFPKCIFPPDSALLLLGNFVSF
jgi:hypothetical protein